MIKIEITASEARSILAAVEMLLTDNGLRDECDMDSPETLEDLEHIQSMLQIKLTENTPTQEVLI